LVLEVLLQLFEFLFKTFGETDQHGSKLEAPSSKFKR
jgi:hypothetical protein